MAKFKVRTSYDMDRACWRTVTVEASNAEIIDGVLLFRDGSKFVAFNKNEWERVRTVDAS